MEGKMCCDADVNVDSEYTFIGLCLWYVSMVNKTDHERAMRMLQKLKDYYKGLFDK
jgi:hypothetical protein